MTAATEWSFRDLEREHGTEAALAMLPHMKGYGKFGKQMAEYWNSYNPSKSRVDVDLCPLCDQPLTSARGCGE